MLCRPRYISRTQILQCNSHFYSNAIKSLSGPAIVSSSQPFLWLCMFWNEVRWAYVLHTSMHTIDFAWWLRSFPAPIGVCIDLALTYYRYITCIFTFFYFSCFLFDACLLLSFCILLQMSLETFAKCCNKRMRGCILSRLLGE